MKIAINGFGRIGRNVFKVAFADKNIEIVGINDLTSPKTLAHLLKYDSNYGVYDKTVEVGDNAIIVDGKTIPVFALRNPAELPWKELGVDVAIESTGVFTVAEGPKGGYKDHIKAGAKKVILTVPAKDKIEQTVVCGVNDDQLDLSLEAFSNASCTTNCLAPISKVLDEKFGIVRGLMTTVHAATATQKTVDGPSKKDWRGGRGILENIIPSSTGAAKAVGKVLPQLNGKLTGMSLRVPTSDVSFVDLTVELKKECTYEEICAAMKEASEGELKGVLGYTNEAVVSTDFRNDSHTSIFDEKAGIQLDGTFVKVCAWYDNEWGYSNKVLEMARVSTK